MNNMRKYVFYFHYNKPYSKKHGVDKWSIHHRNTCYIVDKIICDVPTFSKNNKTQPRVVMKGYATDITIRDNVAHIK